MQARGANGYRLEGVEVTVGFVGRWRGLMARHPVPLLIRTRSVHGFWIRRPLTVVGLDREGRVTAVRVLKRGRIVLMAGARWILELPQDLRPPSVGDRLTFLPGSGEADLHARAALPVCDPDRESR
ncbi:MAG: hypothetical protein WB239_14175 [Acidimicrobiia bacterium]